MLVKIASATFADVATLQVNDSESVAENLIATQAAEWPLALSPNGRWIAYASDTSGQFEIYVQPFPDVSGAQPQLVSAGGGNEPLWGPDGGELFYRGPDGVMVVDVTSDDTFTRRGAPKALFRDTYVGGVHDWDISSNGQRFLMIKQAEPIQTVFPQDIV